jgi:hypothetical protein
MFNQLKVKIACDKLGIDDSLVQLYQSMFLLDNQGKLDDAFKCKMPNRLSPNADEEISCLEQCIRTQVSVAYVIGHNYQQRSALREELKRMTFDSSFRENRMKDYYTEIKPEIRKINTSYILQTLLSNLLIF